MKRKDDPRRYLHVRRRDRKDNDPPPEPVEDDDFDRDEVRSK